MSPEIIIIGGGWYGCHLAASLKDSWRVLLLEKGQRLFAGASGANPARLHLGFHYPRNHTTRALCQKHNREFMHRYGHFTRFIPMNLYAVAQDRSLIDFQTYRAILEPEIDFLEVAPMDVGLKHVEGALMTHERHLVIREVREHFQTVLEGHVRFGVTDPLEVLKDSPQCGMVIDCTFCAGSSAGVDRYEPCVTAILEGDPSKADTIMDGPFPSIYPWDEDFRLSSLTSALHTPLGRYATYEEASFAIASLGAADLARRVETMRTQMAEYWPESADRYRIADVLCGIRAQPLSASDGRFCEVLEATTKDHPYRVVRVRAGKIDAVLEAERMVKYLLTQ